MSIVKESCVILCIFMAMPVILLGCACGWFYAAFADGCNTGYKDWNKI